MNKSVIDDYSKHHKSSNINIRKTDNTFIGNPPPVQKRNALRLSEEHALDQNSQECEVYQRFYTL